MHEWLKGAAESDQGIGRDVQSEMEALAGGFDEGIVEIVAVGEGERVNQDVHAAPLFLHDISGSLNILITGNVTFKGEFSADLFAQASPT